MVARDADKKEVVVASKLDPKHGCDARPTAGLPERIRSCGRVDVREAQRVKSARDGERHELLGGERAVAQGVVGVAVEVHGEGVGASRFGCEYRGYGGITQNVLYSEQG